MYKVVQTSRLYEQIVQQIEDSILKGDLKEGDQLPAERELAQQFGVSRTAVREAVKTLREKGLVEAYAGRGTFVTNGNAHSIRLTLGSHDAQRAIRKYRASRGGSRDSRTRNRGACRSTRGRRNAFRHARIDRRDGRGPPGSGRIH